MEEFTTVSRYGLEDWPYEDTSDVRLCEECFEDTKGVYEEHDLYWIETYGPSDEGEVKCEACHEYHGPAGVAYEEYRY